MRTIILYLLSVLVIAVIAFQGGRLSERKLHAETEAPPARDVRNELSGLPPRSAAPPPEPAAEEDELEAEIVTPETLVAEAMRQLKASSLSQVGLMEAYRLMSELAPEQISAALAAVEKLPHGKARQSLTASVIARWAETDGAAAMDFVLGSVSHANRANALAGALTSWSENDPAGALEWYAQNQGDPEFQISIGAKPLYLLPTIFQGLVNQDISSAFSSFSKLATLEEKHQALDGIATAALGAEDTVKALNMAKVLGGEARSARLRLVSSWGVREPAAAAAWVGTVSDPTEKTEFAAAVAQSWIAYEPAAAVPWLLANTAESKRPETIELATSIWVHSDPNATAEWLGSLPKGEETDRGVSTFARNITNLEPSTALDWAKTIVNDDMRKQTMISVISQWRLREPGAEGEPEPAVEALQASGLPEEEIEDYLRRTRPGAALAPMPLGR